MVPFVVGIAAGGAALLYWITASERNANAEAQAQQICAGCVQAATEGRLNDIVQHIDKPCVACLDAVERYSGDPISHLSMIGALTDPSEGADGLQYSCYHRNDPSQVYRSPQQVNCVSMFGGAGISPANARVLAEQMRKDRELIRIKGNRSPMNGLLSGI
jgi:hypothetical protein